MADLLLQKNLDFLKKQERREKAGKAARIIILAAGCACFAFSYIKEIPDSQEVCLAAFLTSFSGGLAARKLMDSKIPGWPECLSFLAGALSMFILAFFPLVFEKLNFFSLSGAFAAILFFGGAAFASGFLFKKTAFPPQKLDSLKIALHEAGHAASLAAILPILESARLLAAPETGAAGCLHHSMRGTPREVLAGVMLVALGGICAEAVFERRNEYGFEMDLISWDKAAGNWLDTFDSAEKHPVLLHLMLCEQENILMSHIRKNKSVIRDLAQKYQEKAFIDYNELLEFLNKMTVSDELKGWFSEMGNENFEEPPLPKTVDFTY